MPLKLIRTEDDRTLTIERGLYTKRFLLIVDRETCRGCGICERVCHTGAISLHERPKEVIDGKERAVRAQIDIDPHLCDHCGICEATCPFAAITHTLNGEPMVCVHEFDAFPKYIRDIVIDESKIASYIERAETLCPLGLISVEDGKLAIDEKSCPCCRVCEDRTDGAIKVRKIFHGSIKIEQEKCPKGCQNCHDVCPVEDLALRDDGKVYPIDNFCVYCEACVKVCPEPEALTVVRTSIRHTQVKSGAWNKTLEKLATDTALEQEMRKKRRSKVAESMTRRQVIGAGGD